MKVNSASKSYTRIKQRSIPGVWMRSGTSKGLFIRREHLPESPKDWEPILLDVMGSSDGNPQQIDGIGGGTSTTSKVAVVSQSTHPEIDVDYTFVQINSSTGKAEMWGTCGNMVAGVGLFALDEGLVNLSGQQEIIEIKIFATNTNQMLKVTAKVTADGKAEEGRDHRMLANPIPPGSPIKVTFCAPSGSITRGLFPSGESTTHLPIGCPDTGAPLLVRATLIDCANLFVFVDAESMPSRYRIEGPSSRASKAIVETIRRRASIHLGLSRTSDEAAQRQGIPKIAIVASSGSWASRASLSTSSADVEVTAFSMGNLHPTFQLTGAICLGAALSMPNTVASDCWRSVRPNTPPPDSSESLLGRTAPESRMWRIKHPMGWIDSEICWSRNAGGEFTIEKASVICTARKLFQGSVFYRQNCMTWLEQER
ncbi:MAG: hypothetical protein Q9191_004245 [Dirinaria sp. TL-2023a]